MRESDYPALYQAANNASLKAQNSYLWSIRGYAILSTIGAGLSVIGIESKEAAILAALVFFSSLFLSIFMYGNENEGAWYRARALAESIKTSSWRFMMCAEPFEHDSSSQKTRDIFREKLSRILSEHKNLAHDLAGAFSTQEQISTTMSENRSKSLDERKNIYLRERIEDQRKWYADKSESNKKWGNIWFWVLIVLQGVAIAFTVMRVAYPEWKYWPTEIFVVASGNVFTWIQLKRFRELTNSYSLAACEISIAMGSLESVSTEDDFSDFVRDTENAFSREHTQWVAKKQ
jgi:SMODS and SLOG-associating 2TM effector domain 1/SMODS and SLOG-associating 2TM effector domain 3